MLNLSAKEAIIILKWLNARLEYFKPYRLTVPGNKVKFFFYSYKRCRWLKMFTRLRRAANQIEK